jgi:MoxR-like ATPase
MEEHQISADGVTYKLDEPILCNSYTESAGNTGNFPSAGSSDGQVLYEALLGYPNEQEEIAILSRFERDMPLSELKSVATKDVIMEASKAVNTIAVSDDIKDYIVRIVSATRTSTKLILG